MSKPPIPLLGRYEVGKQATIPVPFADEDGADLNLDGKTITCRVIEPDGTGADATSITQRAAGSHIADVVHTPDAVGVWVIAPYVDGEATERYSFYAEAAI